MLPQRFSEYFIFVYYFADYFPYILALFLQVFTMAQLFFHIFSSLFFYAFTRSA